MWQRIAPLFLLSALATDAHAQNPRVIEVKAGFSVILRAPGPVKTVVVGNANLVDVIPQSDRILSLSGKAPGSTNIILLDDAGAEVYSALVNIAGRHTAGEIIVHVAGGSIHSYQTYHCNPLCTVAGTVKPRSINALTGEEVPDPPAYVISPGAPVAPVAPAVAPVAPPRR